jgi:hypothetical protein
MYDAEAEGTDGTLEGLYRTVCALYAKYPGNTPLVMSKDAEGNSFSPWAEYDVGRYAPDSTWSGDFHSPGYHEDEEPCDDDCGDVAIALWPVN